MSRPGLTRRILWNLPADKLNDDRLGRALDAFFELRHSIFASATATAKALQRTNSSLERRKATGPPIGALGAAKTSTKSAFRKNPSIRIRKLLIPK